MDSHNKQNRKTLDIRISPRFVAGCLVLAITTLTSISVASDLIRLTRHTKMTWWMALFNLDREQNISTYYQGLTIFICTMLLAIIAIQKWRQRDSFRFHWAALAAIFQVLSIDEMCALHNQLEDVMAKTGHQFHGMWHYSWVIPGLGFVFVVGLVYLWFLYRLPLRFGLTFAIAGLIYVGGAVGLEMVGAAMADARGGDNQNLPCAMMSNVEELMEMTGIAIFMVSLLCYKKQYVPSLSIQFGAGQTSGCRVVTAASSSASRRSPRHAAPVPAFMRAYSLGSIRVAPGLRPSGTRTNRFSVQPNA